MHAIAQVEHQESALSKVIAVVHDTDRKWLKMLASELTAMGVKGAHEARTPKEVLFLLKDMPVDVVVTHWDKALITFIRRNKKSPKPKIPIILVTSGLQKNMIAEARDAGIDELVAKPASANQIFGHIEHALTHRRAFVRANEYVGPSRRRHTKENLSGPERRKDQA